MTSIGGCIANFPIFMLSSFDKKLQHINAGKLDMAFSSSNPTYIYLNGCKEHNLKNLSIRLPKLSIIVITGVSGSGKSSLAFDTLFAEGQRRYLEYLSSQTRLLIKQIAKPKVDYIEGLSPTLAVGQGKNTLYSRGTIATYTDIYDFLSLLFVRCGIQHSPATHKKLLKYTRQEMIHLILKKYLAGTRIQLLAPIKLLNEKPEQALSRLQQMGFIRIKIDGNDWNLEDQIPSINPTTQIDVVVDRLEIKEGVRERLSTSIDTTLDLSHGILKIQEGRDGPIEFFTEIYVCPETGLSFAPLEVVDFNFNSPRGACPICHGSGGKFEVNSQLLIEDPHLPFIEKVMAIIDHFPKKSVIPFKQFFESFIQIHGIENKTKISDLSPFLLNEFLFGSSQSVDLTVNVDGNFKNFKTNWQGFIPFINRLISQKNGSVFENLTFVKWKICPSCSGERLKPESLACLINEKNISQICQMTVEELNLEISSWKFLGKEEKIAKEILPQILMRLQFLHQVGLGYLQLNRSGKTLSDGEAQRIQLSSRIGTKLSGVIYVLDEPSLGLHRQDIQYLQTVIQELKNLGNTVLMVEHESGLISQADTIIELGPGAGKHGGSITFQGSYSELLSSPTSLTGAWLSGRKTFSIHRSKKTTKNMLQVVRASLHNLNDFSVKIPLGCMVGFCGVSGSGKSTLLIDLIGNSIHQYLSFRSPISFLKGYESFSRLSLGIKQADRLSSRSIPATYVEIMTPLRQLYAETKLAKARGYTPARFSLNKKGGRCEACEGLGIIKVKLDLMPDLFIPCDVCQGKRYNYETLQITWENLTIADILDLTIEECVKVFRHIPTLAPILELMQELGLGYLTLGQHFHTLSGGEIQRLKLVGQLIAKNQEPTLYILDEPSAGLHFEDIHKLLSILHRLVDKGHTIFIIEHHLDLLQQTDWLIELGPGGGPKGGHLIFEGTPAQLLKASTPTAIALRNRQKKG